MDRKDMRVNQFVRHGRARHAACYRVLSTAPHNMYGEPTKGGRYVKCGDEHGRTWTVKPGDLVSNDEWYTWHLLRDQEQRDRASANARKMDALCDVKVFLRGLNFTEEEVKRAIRVDTHECIDGTVVEYDWSFQQYGSEEILPKLMVELGVIKKMED